MSEWFRVIRGPKRSLALALACIAVLVGSLFLLRSIDTPTDSSRQATTDRDATTIARMAQLDQALYDFRQLTGKWPTSLGALTAVVQIKQTNILVDGWGREFIILSNSNAPTLVWLVSYGEDGKPGGTGLDADIEQLLK